MNNIKCKYWLHLSGAVDFYRHTYSKPHDKIIVKGLATGGLPTSEITLVLNFSHINFMCMSHSLLWLP